MAMKPLVRDPEALERMALAFDLYEAALTFKRQQLRREHPEWSEEEIDAGIRAWHLDRPDDLLTPSDEPGGARRV